MRLNSVLGGLLALSSSSLVSAFLTVNETSHSVEIANDRLVFSVNKSIGAIDVLTLDGQDLLGSRASAFGIGPYLDCYCVPSGSYTPGSIDPTYKVFQGVDASHVKYGGVVMSEVYPPTGQLLEQYWFLRDGETGLHTFSRIAYHNSTTPFLRNLQEFRTLFRPSTNIWTHLITDDQLWAPLPVPNPASGSTANSTTVQDATWYLGNRTGDPYVEQFSDYFTKYTFAAVWRDHTVHGMFADGSYIDDKSTFGAWLVMNTKDTYFGGPLHSDLVVDGIVYNYLVSNHHGDGTPNITDGFDRTFGPQYYHFNKGPAGGSWQALRDEAVKFASPSWNAAFYDSIAQHVPNYVPTGGRGSWKAQIALPKGAKNAIAVLAQDGVDFQDNVFDTTAYQYWADIESSSGKVQIDRIKAGTYRLTVYADGIFGDYVHDGIVVKAGKTTDSGRLVWSAESAGRELWRIGTPDKSAGEWRHGDVRDAQHPLHPPEYRIYFGAYDFIDDFPNGVRFHVGTSDEAKDFNYIHWSVFGGYANFLRPVQVEGHGEINNWTITFDLKEEQLRHTSLATFTIQLAGAKTAAGNTDVFNATQEYNNLPFVVVVNGHELEPWIIPYYQSSSCGVRSGVVCYQVSHKFTFPTAYLTAGEATNEIILSLPYNATDYESALLPRSVYVQYDALRLEVK
ncbi:polysaccharide lyase family 4 protein [Thermothielavioides terrestris NRRL 8126]|uniref:rhamnogalacturonan endolyase n=1 Tax=Thermothielavioides terrestris (strain ATCC 38088 / NRRL 8126) TaxID=578455 RepID=G2R1V5_THETT|nr:polysaccharide lyase family 4 protein [Thermothielavioides terrestris NRRL 8126]AEO64931.1 polysaccharide lyase family 4 protein [Thermothielavioides terrestris NRRL 8126]